MPFCHAPWTNIDISPQGHISPCCKFRHEHYADPALNINTSSIKEYLNSDTLTEIRYQWQNGQWPLGCERCKFEEDHGITSKRQLDYQRWREHFDQFHVSDDSGLLTGSVAFGNTCNLKCITCNPYSSSRWQQEYKILFDQDIPPNHFYKHGFIDELLSHAPNLIHLDIPGGEPFLSGVDQQKELLQRYKDLDRARIMGLHYTTNGTTFPNQDWWESWQDFREIDLQISLDAIGAKAEYIRYPCDWTIVESNIQRYIEKERSTPNLRLSVSVTVSAYNIGYLDELLDYVSNIGLPKPWLGRVHNPVHMKPTIWIEPARELIIEKLSSSTHKELTHWANMLQSTDDSNHFELFKKMTRRHDSFRGTDFNRIFPEMARFL